MRMFGGRDGLHMMSVCVYTQNEACHSRCCLTAAAHVDCEECFLSNLMPMWLTDPSFSDAGPLHSFVSEKVE